MFLSIKNMKSVHKLTNSTNINTHNKYHAAADCDERDIIYVHRMRRNSKLTCAGEQPAAPHKHILEIATHNFHPLVHFRPRDGNLWREVKVSVSAGCTKAAADWRWPQANFSLNTQTSSATPLTMRDEHTNNSHKICSAGVASQYKSKGYNNDQFYMYTKGCMLFYIYSSKCLKCNAQFICFVYKMWQCDKFME